MKTDFGNLFFDAIIILILAFGIAILILQYLGLMNVSGHKVQYRRSYAE